VGRWDTVQDAFTYASQFKKASFAYADDGTHQPYVPYTRTTGASYHVRSTQP
jgi:hypothetical protein